MSLQCIVAHVKMFSKMCPLILLENTFQHFNAQKNIGLERFAFETTYEPFISVDVLWCKIDYAFSHIRYKVLHCVKKMFVTNLTITHCHARYF